MSIYVACQCGQAFSAPPELAGQTLACPSCQRPLTVPTGSRTPAPPGPHSSSGFGADPFGGNLAVTGMPTGLATGPQKPQPLVRGEEDSPLLVWLSIGGGGLALLLVICLLIYNGTRRPATQVATTPTAGTGNVPSPVVPSAAPPTNAAQPATTLPAAAATTLAPPINASQPVESSQQPTLPVAAAPAAPPVAGTTTVPPATDSPAKATIPVAAQLPAADPPAAAAPEPEAAFTPPRYGGMVASPDGKYEVWLPSAPQKFDPALDISAFLPKPKGQSVVAFGKQGPTEMCSISIAPGVTAAEIYGEMERAFPGQPETKTIKFAGVDARQYDFAIEITEGKFVIRTIAFVIDGTGYTMQTLSITGQADTDENKAFFASFRRKKTRADE